MNKQLQDELDLIKNCILQVVSAEAIYLFGSHAYGTPRDDSDIDIYVVVPDETDDISELYGDIGVLLWKKKSRPLDMLMGRSSVFSRRKTGPTLERKIASEGVVLYGV
jgi:predicted nucleotidyltransferase